MDLVERLLAGVDWECIAALHRETKWRYSTGYPSAEDLKRGVRDLMVHLLAQKTERKASATGSIHLFASGTRVTLTVGKERAPWTSVTVDADDYGRPTVDAPPAPSHEGPMSKNTGQDKFINMSSEDDEEEDDEFEVNECTYYVQWPDDLVLGNYFHVLVVLAERDDESGCWFRLFKDSNLPAADWDVMTLTIEDLDFAVEGVTLDPLKRRVTVRVFEATDSKEEGEEASRAQLEAAGFTLTK